jgi:hypothetical protein
VNMPNISSFTPESHVEIELRENITFGCDCERSSSNFLKYMFTIALWKLGTLRVAKQIQCRLMRNLSARIHERQKRFLGSRDFAERGEERECLARVSPPGPLKILWDSRIILEGIIIPLVFLLEFYM